MIDIPITAIDPSYRNITCLTCLSFLYRSFRMLTKVEVRSLPKIWRVESSRVDACLTRRYGRRDGFTTPIIITAGVGTIIQFGNQDSVDNECTGATHGDIGDDNYDCGPPVIRN